MIYVLTEERCGKSTAQYECYQISYRHSKSTTQSTCHLSLLVTMYLRCTTKSPYSEHYHVFHCHKQIWLSLIVQRRTYTTALHKFGTITEGKLRDQNKKNRRNTNGCKKVYILLYDAASSVRECCAMRNDN
jgi:hypothetical protein